MIAYLYLIYLLASLLNLALKNFPSDFSRLLKNGPSAFASQLCSIDLWKIAYLPLLLTSTWYSFENFAVELRFEKYLQQGVLL